MITLDSTDKRFIIYKDIIGELPITVTCVFIKRIEDKTVSILATVQRNHSFYEILLDNEIGLKEQVKLSIYNDLELLYTEQILIK